MEYTEVNYGNRFPSLQPSIITAQDEYLRPLLGTYLDYLIAQVNATPTTEEADLLALLRPALADISIYLYIPIGDVTVTENGIRRAETDKEKTAYKYQLQNAQAAYIKRGLIGLEKAIAYMHANATNYTNWTADASYQRYLSLFIKNGTELQNHVSALPMPMRMYMLLRSTMYNVQELTIRPAVTDAIYEDLQTAISNASLSPEQTKLLGYLQSALAHFTIMQGVPQLVAKLQEDGISIIGENGETSNSNRKQANDNQLNSYINTNRAIATQWLDRAIDYINKTATASIFPTWYATQQAAATQPTTPPVNETSSSLFSL